MASPTTQTAVDRYVAAFTDFQIDHPAPAWLSAKRRDAMEAFKTLGFPTVRDEEWKIHRHHAGRQPRGDAGFPARTQRQRAQIVAHASAVQRD